MRTKAIWIIVTVTALALAFTVFSTYPKHNVETRTETNVTDSIVFDTIKYMMPEPKDSVVIRYEIAKLPVKTINTHTIDTVVERVVDSVEVIVPITKKEYGDSTYHAWISGYSANLDSISVYPKTIYRTNTITYKQKPKRFGLGVHAGYGISKNGLSPYIGVGVHYNIFSW